MDFSDRFRSFWNDKKKPEEPQKGAPREASSGPPASKAPPPNEPRSSKREAPKPAKSARQKPAPLPPEALISPAEPAPPSDQELSATHDKDQKEAEEKLKALDREAGEARLSAEKIELEAKNRREAHQQNSQLLRMDAEREIQYLEQKLQEDSAAWSKQLSEREKIVQETGQKNELGQLEKKAAFENQAKERQDLVLQTENTLKDQQAKLARERQKWQEALRAKDAELLHIKQDLARRESALEEELRSQETQQKAAKELWETRLKELEKQWADKRKAWEDAMKTTEDERLRLQQTFQERQSTWQLEQERRVQDITRRQERATEKLTTLQSHFNKEAHTWKQHLQTREEQVKELRVKLMLSETDAKGRAEQAQKLFQEKVVTIAQQVQNLQSQLNEEQAAWKKTLETKEAEISQVKSRIQAKLREMEGEYLQKMSALNGQKDSLSANLDTVKLQQTEQQRLYDERMRQFASEQGTLENTARERLSAIQKTADQETLRLQAEIQTLERHKEGAESELQALRQKSQEEIRVKEDALKTLQAAVAEQETALKSRIAPDEEAVQRQVQSLKTRHRALEREVAKVRESLERIEKEHASAVIALEIDSRGKQEDLEKRCVEQETRLKKRLEERKLALSAFLEMKKTEETRLQTQLREKEKERADLSARLADLPRRVEEETQTKRVAAHKEAEKLQSDIAKAQDALTAARDEYKTSIQAKAAHVGGIRQALEAKEKERASALRSTEQMWASERAGIEKQLTAAQADIDRNRAHWQSEIAKKEQEGKALEDEIRRQESLHRQALEREEKALQEQVAPLEKQRDELTQNLEQERLRHEEQLGAFEKQSQELQAQTQQGIAQGKADEQAQEARFREERARLKARGDSLKSEQAAAAAASDAAYGEKGIQVEQLESQLREQAVGYEARRRDLIHGATVKSRTLQDILRQLEGEMKLAQETFPQELRLREEKIVQLNAELAQEQERHQRLLMRYQRAMNTLTRRGHQKTEALQNQLARLKDEWAKKLAGRDAEIAALQSDIMAKEAERQGELDRLAKQFAEERFQLEKTKEELEWKLKDHKEVSERQLAGREKEIRFVDAEIQRVKAQREQQLMQRAAAFEAEKQKAQSAVASIQAQVDEEGKLNEAAMAAKERELQVMIARSKKHLTQLGEEFNQKVSSWQGTNETLTAQIGQLKIHWSQAQDHWETLRKEKTNELAGLRQELIQWESRLESDVQTLERTHDQERQTVLNQVRRREKEFEEAKAVFDRRLADKEEEVQRVVEDIRQRESGAELQWRTALEQWQTDKQNLEQEKIRTEQELIQLQSRSEAELRELEEVITKLRVDVSFKESQIKAQQERLRSQHEKELIPLRDQGTQASARLHQEKAQWESRLQTKENDLKITKTRLAWREKRLREEIARQEKELGALRQAAADELHKVRSRYEAEHLRLSGALKERRGELAVLQSQEAKASQGETQSAAAAKQALQGHRQHLEQSIRQLEAQRDQLKGQYEMLIAEREAARIDSERELKTKDAELHEAKQRGKRMHDLLRQEMETIQQFQQKLAPSKSNRQGSLWSVFELAVQHYKAQRWNEAADRFQECLRQDPNWSAAFQYLALVFQAQGQDMQAAWAAQQALEKDPDNAQLAAWTAKLQGSLNVKRPPAA